MSERAGVLLIRDGHVALIERHRDGDHYFVAPGGGIGPGERSEDAAAREAREELGIEVRLVGHALTIAAPARGRSTQYYFYAEADTADFGPMSGPEQPAEANSYNRVWVDLGDVERLDLRPRELLGAILR